MANFGLFRGFSEKLFQGELPINLGMIAEDFDDTDALQFFSRVTTAGGTLTTTEQAAIATLVVNLKSAGLWTKFYLIYPMVGSSAASCAQNLKSSSFTGTFAGGWSFSSFGAKPDGTSGYLNTNLNWNSETELNNVAFGAYWNDWNASLNNAQYYGVLGGGGQNALIRGLNGASDNYINDAGAGQVYSAGNGLHAMNRANSTQVTHFLNTNANTQTVNSTNKANLNFYFAGANGFNTFQYYRLALAFISTSFSSSEWAAFYNAVTTFQTTLSRNV